MLVGWFRVEHGAIGLDRAFEAVLELVLESERIAAHSIAWTMPCFWATGVTSTPSTRRYGRIGGPDRRGRRVRRREVLQPDWAEAVDQRRTECLDQEGSLLAVRATDAGREVQFRFADRDQFDTFRELPAERDHSFELLELFEPGAPRQTVGEVTPAQQEALVTATERGYYQVPRTVTTGEVAEDLGTTQQSVSELLRHGTETLVRSTLVTD
jgi:hypothetical protein